MPGSPSPSSRTLARLSFWVSPERRGEFEAAHQKKLVSILKKHGLVESTERGRKTVEEVWSRLFEVEGPAAIIQKREALIADPDWQRAVQELDATLEILGKGFQRSLQVGGLYLSPYRTPAGPGIAVPAGPGRQMGAGRGRGHWRTFDATDGLPGGVIRAVLQDRAGYLWIGSFGGGLSRYDGHSFKPLELTSRMVQSVIEDLEGNLWIGTYDQGLFRYDGQGFAHFTTQDGLAADAVSRVFQDREGQIWAGTINGLSRYNGHGFESFTTQNGLPGNQVYAIFQDREGYLWVGTGEFGGERHRGGVSRYDGRRFQSFTTEEGLAFDAVWSILQDREGIFWFGTEAGVSRYDGQHFQTFTTEDGLAANDVWSILQDQEGVLWFGTKGGGVSRYDGKRFTTFTTQDGLGANSLEAIFEDREGNLWFGTWGGLSRYESQCSTAFTTADGLAHDDVLALLQDREGVFWFGTPGGLSRYDGRTFTTFTTQDGLAENRVSWIVQDREGHLWFAHSDQTFGKGVTRYDGQRFTKFSVLDGLGSDRMSAIFQDQAGSLWFGGTGVVSRSEGAQFEHFAAADGLMPFIGVSFFQDQEGVLWFGSASGLSWYDGRSVMQEGRVDNQVLSICQDQQGMLWLGTFGGGVLRYDGQGFKRLTARDGLADDSVFSALCDLQGRTWFGTRGGGVSLYDGQVFQTFTAQEGLGSNNISSILQDQEGDLWFGTTQGVTRYRPPKPSAPPVYIDAVVADRRHEGVAELEIPASVRLLAFEFHGISFKTRPEAMAYRYRLEGYEEEWRNTHSRRVEYQDLPIGEYTFQVRAVNRDLNYSEPAVVQLKVVPDPRDARIDELEQRVRERTQELEEKNRALVMEAALERVRARALRMQKSEDIPQAAAVVFQELRDLGLSIWICGFVIIDEEKDEGEIWYATPGGEAVQSEGRITQLSTRPNLQGLYAAWKRKDVFFCEDLVGEALEKQRRYLLEVVPYLRSLPVEAFPQRLVSTRALFPQGFLSIWGPEPNSEAGLEIVKRFTAAFSLIYTRFLDLQQAEEQAKQQARAAAIEKVRAEALSMRSTDDLHRVVAVLFIEMCKLGVETPECGIYFEDEATGDTRGYLAGLNPRQVGLSWSSTYQVLEFSGEVATYSWEFSPSFSEVLSTWKRGGKVVSKKVHWTSENLLDGYQSWGLPDKYSKEELIEKLGLKKWAGEMWGVNVPFSHGVVAFTEREFSQEHVTLLQELAQALDLGYLRFKDFQKLEEGNSALSSANKELFAVNKELQQTLEEKEKAQEALVRSESLAAIGSLVAGVAHELNNPLGAAYSLTQTVQEMIEEDTLEQLQQEKAEIVDHLAFSRKELNRAKEIVASLLGLSRQNQDYTEAVDLNTVVQDALRVLHNQYKKYEVNITEEYEEGLPAVQGNFAQLGQVCMNLIKNAIEALKGQEGQIALRTYRDAEYVIFECADTGPGIPAEVQQRIFQPFFTTKGVGEGTGLGLYICHQTIEKHRGSIELDSEVGKGTVFRVRLPLGSR